MTDLSDHEPRRVKHIGLSTLQLRESEMEARDIDDKRARYEAHKRQCNRGTDRAWAGAGEHAVYGDHPEHLRLNIINLGEGA